MWTTDLIALGRKKGYLTNRDINLQLPSDASADDMDEFLDRLDELHIEVLDDGDTPPVEEPPEG